MIENKFFLNDQFLTVGSQLIVTRKKRGFPSTDVPSREADALIKFYEATDGDNWTTNTGWGVDTTVGNWYGVTVSGGHVTGLDLNSDSNVEGDVSGLSALTNLTYLSLFRTSVSGDVSGFDTMTNLEYLNLRNTTVSGD